MYLFKEKIPINNKIRFKCLGKECGICCKGSLVNSYINFWAKKNNITANNNSKGNCAFLNNNYKCIIYKNRPKVCRLYPIVGINKDYVWIAKKCPGIGKGDYISIKNWIKESQTNKIEPDPDKLFVIHNPLSTITAALSIINVFSLLPYSLILLVYPSIWIYYLLKKEAISIS